MNGLRPLRSAKAIPAPKHTASQSIGLRADCEAGGDGFIFEYLFGLDQVADLPKSLVADAVDHHQARERKVEFERRSVVCE